MKPERSLRLVKMHEAPENDWKQKERHRRRSHRPEEVSRNKVPEKWEAVYFT